MSNKNPDNGPSENVTNEKKEIDCAVWVFGEKETEWERVKTMYTRNFYLANAYGNPSMEMKLVMQGTALGFVTGGVLSQFGFQDYWTKATSGKGGYIRKHLEPRKYLADNRYKEPRTFIHHLKWGMRIALISGSILTISTTCAAYCNKFRVRDFGFSGGFCGCILNWKLGIKGIAKGASHGTLLGTVFGITFVGCLWACGSSYSDMRYWNKDYWQIDIRKKKEALESVKLKKEMEDAQIKTVS